jgi:hypothetical protein
MTEILIVLFTVVVWLSRGQYDPSAPFLTFAFLAWVGLLLWPKQNQKIEATLKPHLKYFKYFSWVCSLMIALKPNLIYVQPPLHTSYQIFRFIPLAICLLSLKLKDPRWLVLPFLLFFAAVMRLSPNPLIDVFSSNTAAADSFLHGLNPYSQTYSDIYLGEYDYTPGFLYWPGALYLEAISRFVFHDIRAILILSWCSASFLIPKRSILLWLSIPFLAFGFEQSWIDPVLSLFAAMALWAVQKKKWLWFAIAVASAASIKQYGFIIGFFSAIYLYLEHPKKIVFKSSLIAAVLFSLLLLPFLIWSFSDFLKMTVTAHTHAAIRPDSLNFTAFWLRTTASSLTGGYQIFFALTGFAAAIAHVFRNRAQRGAKVITEACAIAFGFSMLFGKFAFCNYHWLLISFWLLSLNHSNDSVDAHKARV